MNLDKSFFTVKKFVAAIPTMQKTDGFFKKVLLAFLAIETLSLIGFIFPVWGKIIFVLVVLGVVFLTFKNLEYGLFILLAELITGSKGYLLFFNLPHFNLSIRMALFIVVIIAMVGQISLLAIKTKTCPLLHFLKNKNFKYFVPIIFFIGWGVINAFLSHNDFSYIYQDANGWLFFALIFPVYFIYENKEEDGKKIFKEKIITLLLAATFWMAIKTFVLLFVFSHNSASTMTTVYKWVRDTGVGEITRMPTGFIRIFFQSHIFAIVSFFIVLFSIVESKKVKIFDFLLLTTYAAITILSYSRSNWVGFAGGLAVYLLIILFLKSWSRIGKVFLAGIASMIVSFIFINILITFPHPKPTSNFNTMDIAERATQITNEAGVSSRWKLLTPLWSEIKKYFVMGHGYGSTVTYFSEDPRVLETSPTGELTTFAFEWGWLEIWLKLGLIGMAYYLFLIGRFTVFNFHLKTLNDFFTSPENITKLALIIGLITISIISFFSPYMNHPLGIGYLILMSIFIDKKSLNS
ncbi:O-antigen ligase family protein [Candidatus Parcubacteria bacterium]|nr:O-antigen ligase family protein [Patescibacteria group bacterium]MBU4308982.1 O-antigen ligase family protein [Patescibacteria group bacterium]MBU4431703.1 O-antigen ligase family protein [Patescibacteria group bacterium]MBU4577342.1 O-antigen ligase family protein [Patescibacteria group bacterium]MCG2697030.1 O-antigen ligase family protein [Candidatus Parcubacteria bacterium]